MTNYTNTSAGEFEGTTNGTTLVVVIAAPASNNAIRLEHVTIVNRDTVKHGITIIKSVSGGSNYELCDSVDVVIQPSRRVVFNDPVWLIATTKSLQLKMSEIKTTTECDIIASWINYS